MVERVEFRETSRRAQMWDERRQIPVSFLGAGLEAQPLRVSPFTEPAAAIREVINAKKVK
jgi:hypothetical protein